MRRQLDTVRLSTEAVGRLQQKELALRAENEALKHEIALLKLRLEQLAALGHGSDNENSESGMTQQVRPLLMPSEAGKFGEGACVRYMKIVPDRDFIVILSSNLYYNSMDKLHGMFTLD